NLPPAARHPTLARRSVAALANHLARPPWSPPAGARAPTAAETKATAWRSRTWATTSPSATARCRGRASRFDAGGLRGACQAALGAVLRVQRRVGVSGCSEPDTQNSPWARSAPGGPGWPGHGSSSGRFWARGTNSFTDRRPSPSVSYSANRALTIPDRSATSAAGNRPATAAATSSWVSCPSPSVSYRANTASYCSDMFPFRRLIVAHDRSHSGVLGRVRPVSRSACAPSDELQRADYVVGRDVLVHGLGGAVGGGLLQQGGAADAVGAEDAAAAAHPAPGGQVPAVAGRGERHRLDVAFGLGTRPVDVGEADHPAGQDGLLQHRGHRRLVALGGGQEADAGGQFAGRRAVVRRHRRDDLVEGGAGGPGVRGAVRAGQRDRDRDGLGGGEVQRRKGAALVEGVAAAPPHVGEDRHPGLLEGADVALDRPDADLVPRGQLPCADAARRAGAQLLHQCVQAVGAVHTATVRAGSDIPRRAAPFRRSEGAEEAEHRLVDLG